nr:class C sortase [Leucobacter edaphi]
MLALVGLSAILYPGTAGWWSQFEQSQVIRGLSEVSADQPARTLERELERARAYNAQLTGGARIDAAARKPSAAAGASGPDGRYEELLHGDAAGAMGRLRIPVIGVDLPIYHGTDDETLLRGVGHLQGTSLPVGGPSQHSVLTAHRGLSSATLFTDLDRVRRGDQFTLEVFGEVLAYRVIETKVVNPEDTDALFPRQGEDLVTLVTCTPLGINTQRILVTGQRLLPTPQVDIERAGSLPDVPGFPWWAVGLVGGIASIAGYLAWAGFPQRAKRGGDPGSHAGSVQPDLGASTVER